MSFQAGVFQFDFGTIPGGDAAKILNSVSECDGFVAASWQQEGLLMVHADLPAADQTADAAQPCSTATAAITFDGRIDNREDLQYLPRGAAPGAASDAALALAVYEKAGCDGFLQVIGDWSLAIWDKVRKRLVLASDYAGVRPLYYSTSGSCIRWSTRLEPLACEASADELDDEYVAGLLMRGGSPNRTPWRGVFSVPPGHFLIASGSGVKIQPFWTLPVHDSIRYTHAADYEEHLRHLFRDAVLRRLSSGTPVISELSGGLDSSSVACMANRLIRSGAARAPSFVTLTYDRDGSRDRHFQKLVEAFCGFESVHISTSGHAFLTEAQAGGASPAFWRELHSAISGMARRFGAGTLLTGSLGDLVMGNWYDDSAQVLRLFRSGHWLGGLREALAWSQTLAIPIAWVLGRAAMSALPPSVPGLTLDAVSGASGDSRSRDDSISPPFRARMELAARSRFSSPLWREAPPERRTHFRGLVSMLELRKLQPPEGLEHLSYTHPYSHRPLVHYMLSVPANIVCGPGEPRRLMRRAFQNLWPPELGQRRSKDSFGGVFLDSLRPLAARLLAAQQPLEVVRRGYIDPVSLAKRLERIVHSLDCNEPQLRQILLLEFWLRTRTISGQN